MRSTNLVRDLFSLGLVAGSMLLAACVQPQAQTSADQNAGREVGGDETVTAERVADLARQLEATSRYAARMEEIYAAQEAEILALRELVAHLSSDDRAPD